MADEDSKSWFSDTELEEIDNLGKDAFTPGNAPSPPPAQPPPAAPPAAPPAPPSAPPGIPDFGSPPPVGGDAPAFGAAPAPQQMPPPPQGEVISTPVPKVKGGFLQNKRNLIIIGVVALVAVLGAVSYFVFFSGPSKTKIKRPPPPKKAAVAKPPAEAPDAAVDGAKDAKKDGEKADDKKKDAPPPPPKKSTPEPPPPPKKVEKPKPAPEPVAETALAYEMPDMRAVDVGVLPTGNGAQIVVRFNGMVGAVKTFKMPNPDRVVIDVANAGSKVPSIVGGDGAVVERIRVGFHPEGKSFSGQRMPYLRMVVDLATSMPVSISRDVSGEVLTVNIVQ